MAEPETIESVLGTGWIAGRLARFPEERLAAVVGAAHDAALIARCLDALHAGPMTIADADAIATTAIRG